MTSRTLPCALALALAWASTGVARSEPDVAAPYVAVRALEQLQDRIAAGDTLAASAHAKTIAHTALVFARTPPTAWSDVRNARALVLYLFSGGDAGKIAAAIPRGALPKDEQALYDGALAYGLGQDDSAREILLPIPAKSLPSNLGGHLALVQATLLAGSDKATAIDRLDLARLLEPGTLVEEAALRQEMLLIDIGSGDLTKFASLARRYNAGFARSVYYANFRQLLTQAALEIGKGDSAATQARLDQLLGAVDPADRCRLYLAVAREALLNGRLTMAAQASDAAGRLARRGGVEQARATLYFGAATIAGSRYDLGRKALDGPTGNLLEGSDQALRQSAIAVADMIRDPAFAAQPNGSGDRTAVFSEGARALDAADDAVKMVAK